jgi:hypothetical protein
MKVVVCFQEGGMSHQGDWIKERVSEDFAGSISSTEESWRRGTSVVDVGEEVVEEAQVPGEREGFEVQEEVEEKEGFRP